MSKAWRMMIAEEVMASEVRELLDEDINRIRDIMKERREGAKELEQPVDRYMEGIHYYE